MYKVCIYIAISGRARLHATPPSLKVGGEIRAEPNLLLIKVWLYIRNIMRFLNKGAVYPNLLLVYLLQKEPTFKDGGVIAIDRFWVVPILE